MHHPFLYISLPLQSKTIDLDWQNNNSARASRLFVHFFAVTAWLWRELNAYFQVLWSLTWTQRNDIYFFKLVSSSPWPFCCFYLMYASFRSVTDNFTNPDPDGKFFLDLNGIERPCSAARRLSNWAKRAVGDFTRAEVFTNCYIHVCPSLHFSTGKWNPTILHIKHKLIWMFSHLLTTFTNLTWFKQLYSYF